MITHTHSRLLPRHSLEPSDPLMRTDVIKAAALLRIDLEQSRDEIDRTGRGLALERHVPHAGAHLGAECRLLLLRVLAAAKRQLRRQHRLHRRQLPASTLTYDRGRVAGQ